MMKRLSIIFLAASMFSAIASTPIAIADNAIEIAGVLFFTRCFIKENVCQDFFDQFPNVSITLTKKDENSGYTTYEGISVRTQDAFNRHFIQTVVIQKIVTKVNNQTQYNISAKVTDQNGAEVIHPFGVAVREGVEHMSSMMVAGVSIDQPEWGSKVTPKFYLGQKFTQDEPPMPSPTPMPTSTPTSPER